MRLARSSAQILSAAIGNYEVNDDSGGELVACAAIRHHCSSFDSQIMQMGNELDDEGAEQSIHLSHSLLQGPTNFVATGQSTRDFRSHDGVAWRPCPTHRVGRSTRPTSFDPQEIASMRPDHEWKCRGHEPINCSTRIMCLLH
jgi:hypothetical protein